MTTVITPDTYHMDPEHKALADRLCADLKVRLFDVYEMRVEDGFVDVSRYLRNWRGNPYIGSRGIIRHRTDRFRIAAVSA